jgi:hypothetical protein
LFVCNYCIRPLAATTYIFLLSLPLLETNKTINQSRDPLPLCGVGDGGAVTAL